MLDGEACARARRALGMSREAMSARTTGPHPLSVATIKRAESGHAVYLETARRIAELLSLSVSEIALQDLTERSDPVLDCAPPAISVLPFRWLGPDESGSHLASGLTEDILARLAHSWFPVVSPHALARLDDTNDPAECRAALKVRYWVEGCVRRSGDTARVIAHLVHGEEGRILWTQTFDRDLGEVLGFQGELASCIVSEIGAILVDVEALAHFVQERDEDTVRGTHHACALRPDMPIPLATLTTAYAHLKDVAR